MLGGTLSVLDSKSATTTAVGNYSGVITASGQTSTNYTITYLAGNLAVTPASLTITADGVSRVYGASDPTLGVSYLGFVNGETSSVLGGTLSVLDSKSAATTAVGSYTGAITASGQTSTNYTITYVAGNLTVTPAALTITASGVSRVYGASDPALGVTYSGFVNGETSSVLGGTLSEIDSKAAPTTAVGSYTGVITASGQTATNYTITYVAGNLTVTPAALTITANGVSRVYGASDPALGVTYSGFVNGETSSVLGGTLSEIDSKAAPTTAVGSYTGVITASGQTATNYTITYVAGNLTVTPAALTITANGVSRIYGASDPALGVTYSGFVNGETSSVLGGTLSEIDSKAAPTTAVGSYTGVITASGQTATNYTISYVAGNLSVTPAALTITANGVSRIYGASDPVLGVTYSGFVNGETSSVLGGTLSKVDSKAAPTTAVGSYSGVITVSGQSATNYTITYVAGNLTVTPAALTITANGVSRIYGASDPALGVTYSGFVNGETSSVLGGTLSEVDSKAALTTAVGSYTGVITASGQTATNYTITYVAGNLAVTPAPLTVTAHSITKTYGQTETFAGTEFTADGLVNSDSVASVSLTSSGTPATAPVAGSPYAIIVSNAVGSGLENYTINYVNGTLTVIKASPTITTIPSMTTVVLGTSSVTLNDTAVLSGGYNETGTITFSLYMGSTLENTETVTTTGNGNYTTPTGYTLPMSGAVTGTYQWDASYSSDSNNNAFSENNATNEQVVVSPASPAITTTPNVTTVVLRTSATLKDTAVLSGGYSPTGTITFTLVAPGGGTVDSETVTISGNGTYTTPTGYTLPSTSTVTGIYQWNASYASANGDNNAFADDNATNEQVTVTIPPNVTVTKTADQATIIAGQTAGFVVMITNNGPVAASGFTFSDPLPAGGGNDITWTIDTSTGSYSDFAITGSKGSQSLGLSSSFISGGDSLAPGQNISVHITSPTNAADATNGALATSFNNAGTAAAGVISLGTANNYSVLGLKNTAITNSLVVITGNEGVSQGGSLSNMGPSAVTGNVYEYASGQYSGPGTLGGSIIANSTLLTQNDTDALHASSTAEGLTATQTFTGISCSTTVTGNGGLNVIDINGSINLNNASLTLTGTSSDVFIVNVSGSASFVGTGGLMLGGGVTPNHVLYNFTSSSGTIVSHVGNAFYGTLLAPTYSFNLDGSFIGEIIGGGSSIQLLSNATVNANVPSVLSNTATVSATGDIGQPGEQASATVTVTKPPLVAAGEFATIGFWRNNNGQAVINSFNGSSTATGLGNWLATSFPSLFGTTKDPVGSLTGKTNAQIASVYASLPNNGVTNNDYIQTFAVALGIYADTTSLAGSSTLATRYGFSVSSAGFGSSTYNVQSNGAAFGVANNTSVAVLSILQTINSNYSPTAGTFYGGSSTLGGDANNVLNGINTTGDVASAVALDAPAGAVAYTPAQIRAAYGISSLSLDGTGQTIAIVDAYDDPNIFQAVDAFDVQFGLTDSGPTLANQYGPASSFLTVLNQNGQSTSLPETDPNGPGTDNWEVEESLDVEWAHAIAPGAQIVLVEANSQSLSDLMSCRGHGRQPARRIGRVDELGLPRRPGRLRRR